MVWRVRLAGILLCRAGAVFLLTGPTGRLLTSSWPEDETDRKKRWLMIAEMEGEIEREKRWGAKVSA
jgi:hypothetical protein